MSASDVSPCCPLIENRVWLVIETTSEVYVLSWTCQYTSMSLIRWMYCMAYLTQFICVVGLLHVVAVFVLKQPTFLESVAFTEFISSQRYNSPEVQCHLSLLSAVLMHMILISPFVLFLFILITSVFVCKTVVVFHS